MNLVVSVFMTVLGTQTMPEPSARIVPIIEEPWWQVAGQPDLGELTSEKQQPVDFGVWQAADGTWQLWSCIRHTKCGGHTRLFYRWEGKRLNDANWRPMGIAMQARPELGESPGGLQAPHVVKHDGVYWMAYGDWANVCFATSTDGKTFERVIQPNGKTGAFTEGAGANARDAMLIKIDGVWHCYYTAFPGRQGFVFCRTSPDLRRWSPSCVVCYGGKIGTSPFQIECPHVVEVLPGEFVMFRNQYYGRGALNWVYHSRNPLNFGINDDSKLVCSLPVAAPEIVLHEGKYYIAALNPGLDGIRIARLTWAMGDSPITVELADKRGFATFTNRLHPGNRIGYRFHEHTPIVYGQIPADNASAGIDPPSVMKLEQRFASRPGVLINVIDVKDEAWAPQQWTFYLAPTHDGIDLLLTVAAADVGLNEYYGVQQCFRMSGKTNAAWRRAIAETPAFSEFDLWNVAERDDSQKTSLSYVLRKGQWQALPAMKQSVGARTPLGVAIDTERTGGKIKTMPTVGPYEALMTDPIDSGLITRVNKDHTWVCGIYWQATSHITDHHPADCLHSIVNIGGIPPKSKRAIRGKIYWFKETPDDLLCRWRRDFPAK